MNFFNLKYKIFSVLCMSLIVLTVYFLPRILVEHIGQKNPWISYLYTYIIGSIFYFSSVVFILTRKIHPRRKKQVKLTLTVLTFLLFWGLLFQGVWIYFSLAIPFKGVS